MARVCGGGTGRCVALLASGLVLLATGTVLGAAPASSWSRNVQVNDGLSPLPTQFEPYITLGPGGQLNVAWIDSDLTIATGFTASTTSKDSSARSQNGGNSWSRSTSLALLQRNDVQADPWLVLDERGRLYYSYVEVSASGGSKVLVARSDDGGLTWENPVRVDTVQDFADKPSIASDNNGTIYVAYTNLLTDIRISRSTDGGATWTAPVPVSDGGGNPIGVVVAARPDGHVAVLWQDALVGNILADASSDRGQGWHADVRVNDVPGSALGSSANFPECCLPTLAANSKGNLFAVWPDHRTGDLDIMASRSDDGGTTWSRNIRVNDDPGTRWQSNPAVAVDGKDQVHLTWVDNRTGNYNVFYSTSGDGRRWSKNERVTDAETPNAFRKGLRDYMGLIADSVGNVFSVWVDGRNGNLDIFFARRTAPSPAMLTSTLVGSIWITREATR